MSRFGVVSLMVVDRNTHMASNVGFAPSCKAMLKLAYPQIPREVYDRPEIIQMLDEVDNLSGSIFVLEPEDGQPLTANSTLEKLLEEVNNA